MYLGTFRESSLQGMACASRLVSCVNNRTRFWRNVFWFYLIYSARVQHVLTRGDTIFLSRHIKKSTQNYKVLLELPTRPDKFSLDDHEHCLYGGYDLMNHSCQLYIICEYVGGSLGTWKYVFYFPLLSWVKQDNTTVHYSGKILRQLLALFAEASKVWVLRLRTNRNSQFLQ